MDPMVTSLRKKCDSQPEDGFCFCFFAAHTGLVD